MFNAWGECSHPAAPGVAEPVLKEDTSAGEEVAAQLGAP